MKKVMLIAEAMLGGIRQHVFDIARGLNKEQFEVYLVYSDLRADAKFFEEYDEIALYVHMIRCNEMQRELGIYDLKAYKALKGHIWEIKPDIVHCHSSKAGIVGRLAARKCNVPMVIYTPHAYAFQSPEASKIKRNVYILAEGFLSEYSKNITINVSKGEMELAEKYRLGGMDKLKLVYNGIPDIELCSKQETRERLGLQKDIFYIGVTARCAEQKDPMTFLQIAKQVIADKEDVEFVYIGDGDLQEQMQEWITNNGLGAKIHLLGFRNDASEIVGALDLYLSMALYEGLSYSMIEAMRAGVPIIATDTVGNNELVFEGINGMMFPVKDIDKAVQLIGKQMSEHVIDNRVVRETFKKDFSMEKMLTETERIYVREGVKNLSIYSLCNYAEVAA